MMTAATAIARSVSHTEIVTVPWTAELEIDLLAACDDSADTTDVQEYWGTDEDGAEWRVHLDTTARMETIERAIRDLATQDDAREVDVVVDASEDEDDSLAAAVAQYVASYPALAGWDLCPRWADDDSREQIVLTVPGWARPVGSATATIERWRTSAAEAGDHALVAIIDAAGVKTAAKVYRDARA